MLQLPLNDCYRLVILYHALQHAADGTDPSDHSLDGGEKYYAYY